MDSFVYARTQKGCYTLHTSGAFISAGIWAFFFFAASLMPVIYGMETSQTISASITASRIMSFTSLGYGFCYLSTNISRTLEKPGQAGLISLLYNVLAPVFLSAVLGSVFGFTGIIVGMSLSTYFAFGLYALIRIPQKGKKGFPIYAENFGEEGYSYDFHVTPESIPEVRDAVSTELICHDYHIDNIEILIEEFLTRIMEKNPGKAVLAECVLLFGSDRVRIIIRDDGKLFNFTDENNKIESLNAYVLNSLLARTRSKNYLLTTSFNRNGFSFEKK